MGLYVLDNVKLYEADEDNLVHLAFGDSVWTGCQVIAHVGPDMGVRVGAGSMRYAGLNKTVAQTDLTVAIADPAQPRIDLVHIVGATGVPAIIAGTAASTPKPPPLPAASILVGFVSVAAAAVNIQSSNITDRRLIASDGVVGGLDANKPAAGIAGRLYAARDTGTLYHDDGATLAPIGGTTTNPNLIPNADFGRRTVMGLAMPEVFTDTLGYTKIDAGTAPSVAANVLTFGAANNHLGWPLAGYNANFWRDGRASATFKAVSTTGTYELRFHYVDTNNYAVAWVDGSANQLKLSKVIAGTPTTVTAAISNLVLNQWYWVEIEAQGTTFTARLYVAGTTSPGTTKAASAISIAGTLSAVLADAVIAAGGVTITSNQATAAWGGIATGNGGVYVETWLPESLQLTAGGTLGGQAVGYDDTAAAGPIGKAWALRFYIPVASRTWQGLGTGMAWQVPSVQHTLSAYANISGYGGSGNLVYVEVNGMSSFSWTANTGGWNRKSVSNPTPASLTQYDFSINGSSTATGTASIMCVQLEQGSVVTAWRNAPADDGTLRMESLSMPANSVTVSGTFTEVDSRDMAMNFFLPWDADVEFTMNGQAFNNGASNLCAFGMTVDGVALGDPTNGFCYLSAPNANYNFQITGMFRKRLAAGKHRVALVQRTSGGSLTFYGVNATPMLGVAATRGR